MVRIVLSSAVLLLLFTSAVLPEGGCSSYDVFIRGTEFTWTQYNKKDSILKYTDFQVESVEAKANEITAHVRATARSGSGESNGSISTEYTCKNGVYFADSKHLLVNGASVSKNMDVTYKANPLQYPHNMKMGDTLLDANVTVTSTAKAMGQIPTTLSYSSSVELKNRVCDSTLMVTTPAGTFSCVRIKFKETISVKSPDGKKEIISLDVVEWFSTKVGTVRVETYEKGVLRDYTVLTKFSVPD